jgi:sigma-B regulation protein RsbU (phosphoserine phosphatase)
MSPQPRGDYWALYRQLEKTIRDIQETRDPSRALSVFLESLVDQYHGLLGIEGGRIYRREQSAYLLVTSVGRNPAGAGSAPAGYRIPISYPMIRDLRARGLLIADHSHPDFDPAIEGPLAVDTFAAITVGLEDAWIISFTLSPAANREHVLYSLSTIRHAVIGKLQQLDVEVELLRVQEIQSSLFPRTMPQFSGYDIFGRSQPIDAVGGDVFSFVSLGQDILGIMVADSSGHGLPAALQARDVVTGMRMGLEKDLKIVRVVEKLNRVIHDTSLSSKFVSLFYGELERNGNFIYCNAGHVPGLHYQQGTFSPLAKGGPILGPSPDARYARGYTFMEKDDILVFYSDGITEAHDHDEEEFGLQRLKQVVEEHREGTSREITEALFAAVARFAPDDPLRDDQTVVVARRTSEVGIN